MSSHTKLLKITEAEISKFLFPETIIKDNQFLEKALLQKVPL